MKLICEFHGHIYGHLFSLSEKISGNTSDFLWIFGDFVVFIQESRSILQNW